MINDPYINEMVVKIRLAAITDVYQAMKIYKEMMKYVIPQAYAIPDVIGHRYTLWWPWLKNYSGERTVGYDNNSWSQWIWYDQELKKTMGH